MKIYKRLAATIPFLLACLISTSFTTSVDADVRAQLSSQESYVGMPLTLYIQVAGKGNMEPPAIPQIDGLQIEQRGAPNRSSQVSIINGRRTENSSVTYAYQVTPRRAGTFQIPSLEIRTGNLTEKTRPLTFSAITSETGDLMFAEVTGQQKKTFVGQPIELTLKIWMKPYVDQEREIKLSAQNMWQTISNQQTQWGGFTETIENLAKNPENVRVSETLRSDQNGVEQSYYLYELDATLYPKAAGSLPGEDIQIVAQYPTALGKSRDPFESFFGNSPFSNDDFFGRRGFSPFGASLSVTATRPILTQPDVSSIEVTAIPTEGCPPDYRGAVGQYVIATQASPTTVKAGDPISLDMGIRGTGPMELVQAPPLGQLSSLTSGFKVTNEPLAGVVQNDVKVFSTTLRPRNQDVIQIPAIPFSFFDPDLEQFVTVYSNPIEIKVNKADELSMDSIVGTGGLPKSPKNTSKSRESKINLDNHTDAFVLTSAASSTPSGGWLWLLGVPPLLFVTLWVVGRRAGSRRHDDIRRAHRRIQTASNAGTIAEAVQEFANEKLGNQPHEFKTTLDKLSADCNDLAFAGGTTNSLKSLKAQARAIVHSLSKVRMEKAKTWKMPTLERPVRTCAAVTGCVALMALVAYAAGLASSDVIPNATQNDPKTIHISHSQQEALLLEATRAYQQGQKLATQDAAEAKQSFAEATQKYQSLVDSGIQNSKVFFNLGNACLQSDSVGRAIANYHRAIDLNPFDFQSRQNLHRAQTMVQNENEEIKSSEYAWFQETSATFSNGLHSISGTALTVAWFCFWSLMASALFYPIWKMKTLMTAVTFALLILCGSMVARHHKAEKTAVAVIIADDVAMHTGNGKSFAALPGSGLSQGMSVKVLQKRGNWLQVRSSDGAEGWIESDDLEVV